MGVGFRADELSDALRSNFIGVVVFAEFPCDCVICRKGKERLEQIGSRPRTERVHLIIKPITQYNELQHAWYNVSRVKWSAFGGFVLALDKLGFTTDKETPSEQWKDVKNFLVGKAFEFTSENPVKFVEDLTGQKRPKRLPPALVEAKEQWFPIRVVSEDELKNYTIDDLQTILEKGKAEVEDLFRRFETEEISIEEFEEFSAFQ